MGGGENPTYSLIFSKMILFLYNYAAGRYKNYLLLLQVYWEEN